jgi:hypothetical protein
MKVVLAILGGLLGAIVGGVIGIGSGYPLAELCGVTRSETQAYFQLFVAMPLGALLGIATGAAALSLFVAERKTPLLIVTLLGTALLVSGLVMGLRWATPARPAEFRVRNAASEPLDQLYLGHDFRRSTKLGTLAPGATSEFHTVDLDARGSFNGVHGRLGNRNVQLTLPLDQQTALEPGRYTYVVQLEGETLELELIRE